jgi:hypothetical protein
MLNALDAVIQVTNDGLADRLSFGMHYPTEHLPDALEQRVVDRGAAPMEPLHSLVNAIFPVL